MTPKEIIEEVKAITRRPEKEALMYSTLNKVLKKLTTSTELAQDLVEGIYTLPDPTQLTIDVALSEFPRFRKMCYLVPIGYNKSLSVLVPDNMFDASCREIRDSYYVAGNVLRINLARNVPAIRYGYFAYPEQQTADTLDADKHWLCGVGEHILVDEVCAAIFRGIGDDASAGQHFAEARLNWESLRQDVKYGGLIT